MKTVLFTLLALAAAQITLAQPSEPIQLPVSYPNAGPFMLDGTLTLPADTRKPVPVVLLIAGSGPTDRDCNSGQGYRTNAYRQLADSLGKRGVAVLRYDKRLVGKSLPADLKNVKEKEMRFSMMVDDAVGFIQKLRADRRFSTVIVAGHSEGSLVGMLAARQTNAAGYISIAGVGRNSADVIKEQLVGLPDSLRQLAGKDLDSLRAGQLVHSPPPALTNLLRPSVQPYMISWLRYDPAVEIRSYTGPILIIQGKHDMQVPVTEAEILKAARPDAKLVVFDEMSHILKNGPNDKMGSFATYNQPDLPLTPGLAAVIANFAKKPRGVN